MQANTIEKRILIMDAQPVCRHGIARILESERGLRVVSAASSLEEALVGPDSDIDIIILDLASAKSRGISALRDLKTRFANASCLVLTSHDERLFAERCLKAGAVGYVMKRESVEEVRRAILAVARGQLHVSDQLKSMMIARLSNPKPESSNYFDRLSDKELLIIQQIGLSKNNKEIARELQISVKTIESHRSRIKTKLRLESPQELMRYALRLSGDSSC